MSAITPAQLSLELNVSQKRIRDFLRGEHGTLPDGTTRWLLGDSEAEAVRSAFAATDSAPIWTLEPGDTVLRREVHAAYRGSQQAGIVTSSVISDILIFTSLTGNRYGYDAYEGVRPDGSFAYTGQGQRGDQKMEAGNRAIRDSSIDNRPIRLFSVERTRVTYVGRFMTGTPPFHHETIADVDNTPRQGIIFNLIPVDADNDLLAGADSSTVESAHTARWTPPDASDVVVAAPSEAPADRTVSRVEFLLQADFGAWLRRQGSEPQRLQLHVAGTVLEPDLFVEDREWIVEAKKSSARAYVRTAIGQVLDYVHVAKRLGYRASPVILLPGKPTHDLVDLLHRLGITLVVRSPGDDFEVVTSNPPA